MPKPERRATICGFGTTTLPLRAEICPTHRRKPWLRPVAFPTRISSRRSSTFLRNGISSYGYSRTRPTRCSGSALCERNRRAVAAADDHANAFTLVGRVASGKNRRKSGGSARFGNDRGVVPEVALRRDDVFVAHEHHTVDIAPCDGKDEIADARRRQRVVRDAAGGCV